MATKRKPYFTEVPIGIRNCKHNCKDRTKFSKTHKQELVSRFIFARKCKLLLMPFFCRNCAHYSSARPPPNRSTKINDDQNNNKGSDTSDTSDFKPVNLSYRALECRGQERDCPSKSPLIIHHSLFGRKENWNPISEVNNDNFTYFFAKT